MGERDEDANHERPRTGDLERLQARMRPHPTFRTPNCDHAHHRYLAWTPRIVD